MLFKQLFDKVSSTYTYLVASAKGREALIIDPVLEDVENYIKLLNELNLKLSKMEIRTSTFSYIIKLNYFLKNLS